MNGRCFVCPACREVLVLERSACCCLDCGQRYPLVDGIIDFCPADKAEHLVDEGNSLWLDPLIVGSRNVAYSLMSRELKGMSFCMEEMGRRSFGGCRILEVGMGTGHFTRWLASVCVPGTEVFAFDLSWPMIEAAKRQVAGMSGITLFRADSRSALPFESEFFDMVLVRLAPFGQDGLSKNQAAYKQLRRGGWFFSAGWRKARAISPTESAIEQGFDAARYTEWQYQRRQTPEELQATNVERRRLFSLVGLSTEKDGEKDERVELADGSALVMTSERLLMAHKGI